MEVLGCSERGLRSAPGTLLVRPRAPPDSLQDNHYSVENLWRRHGSRAGDAELEARPESHLPLPQTHVHRIDQIPGPREEGIVSPAIRFGEPAGEIRLLEACPAGHQLGQSADSRASH